MKGKSVCITGKMTLDRNKVAEKLGELGATVTPSVTKKTQVLFAGAKAGSKLEKAQKMGILILDEADLERVLAGESLDEIVADKGKDQEPAGDSHEVEVPRVDERPRDGSFRSVFPGTKQVSAEGEFVAGKKHGMWREWHENGQLKSEGRFEHGLRQGRLTQWHATGHKWMEGDDVDGFHEGVWEFWYENGALEQRYLYQKGKKHGEYVWDLKDGSPRARGAFSQDLRSGTWTWYQEETHEKICRGHDERGNFHGENVAWFKGEKLAERSFYRHGRPIGVHETWDPQGNLISRKTYDDASYLVETIEVQGGDEKVQRYMRGIPEELAKDREKLKKIASEIVAKKDVYQKTDVLTKVVGGAEGASLVLHLWREGLLDLPSEPELFEVVSYEGKTLSGQELLRLLKEAKPADSTQSPYLPQWHQAFDRLLIDVYAHDPAPIEAGWRELPEPMKRGVGFVLTRLGVDVHEELEGIAELLAEHREVAGWSNRIQWPGRKTKDELTVDFPNEVILFESALPTRAFDEFLTLFGKERYIQKQSEILKSKIEKKESIPFKKFKYVIETMPIEELPAVFSAIEVDNWTTENVEMALFEWRNDGAEELTHLALAIEGRTTKWPALCCAIVKRAEEGLPVDERLLDALALPSDSPSMSWIDERLGALAFESFKTDPAWIDSTLNFANDIRCGTEPIFNSMKLLFQALRAVPESSRRKVIARTVEAKWGKTNAAPFLHLVNDSSFWQEAIDLIEKDPAASSQQVAMGLGHLPLDTLPWLEGARKRAKKKDVKASFHRAMVGVLARAASRGEVWDERWDSFLKMEIESASYHYPYVMPLLRKAIHGLPSKRGEKVLLRELDTAKPKAFARAMTFVASHPTQAVLQAAFKGLMVVEDRIPSDQESQLGQAMKGIPDLDKWITWVLKAGGGGYLTEVFAKALGGSQMLEALKKAMASEGAQVNPSLDDIDKLVAMAKAALGKKKGIPIYVLRRWTKPTEAHPIGLNRIGGLPPGVDEKAWPMRKGEPMVHLFTLDLATMPELRQKLGGKRSFSFFMANPNGNEASAPFNDETAVVMYDDEKVKEEGRAPEKATVWQEESFECVRIHVPADVFSDEDDPLQQAIFGAHARVLGKPIWIQEQEDGGTGFVMQLDEGFVDVNLGDMGVLYVYEDGGFWQCH